MVLELGFNVSVKRLHCILIIFLILAGCKRKGESLSADWQIIPSHNSASESKRDSEVVFADSLPDNLKQGLPNDLLIPTARNNVDCELYGGVWNAVKHACEQTSESCESIYFGLEVHPDDHSRCILLKAEAGSKEACLWSGGAWDDTAGARHHCHYTSIACARIYPGSVVDPKDDTQCIIKTATVEE